MPRRASIAIAIGMGSLSLASQAFGSDPAGPEDLLFQEIPVVVGPTRTERSALDVPSSVTVLTAEEIRETGATSLEELLHWIPGLEVMRFSRADVSASMRGLNSTPGNKLLVLIDGRSVYLDFFGNVFWEGLNVTLQEIDRIEFIRGPGSVMYGANAQLGTIHIITRSGAELPALTASGALGPSTRHLGTTAAARTGRLALKSSLEYRSLDHFRNRRNDANPLVERRRDEVGLRDRLGNVGLSYRFTDGAELELGAGDVRDAGDLLFANQVILTDGHRPYFRARYSARDWHVQAFYSSFDYEVLNSLVTGLFPPIVSSYDFFSSTADLEAQRQGHFGRHDLLVGFNARRLGADSSVVLGSREAEMLYGAFVQDEITLTEHLTANLALRADRHPKAGLQYSPRASLIYAFSENGRVRGSISRSFRSPTMLASYANLTLVPGLAGLIGNEDLDAESVTAYELGLRFSPHRRAQLGLDLFFERLEDIHLVGLAPAGPFPISGTTMNGGETSLFGGELTLEFQLGSRARGFASYSFVEAHGSAAEVTPRHKASLGLRGRLLSRLRYALSASYVDHTEVEEEPSPLSGGLPALNPVAHPADIRSRLAVDGFLAWRVNRRLELGLKARNLFHQVRRHYPIGDEIGSELLISVRYELSDWN